MDDIKDRHSCVLSDDLNAGKVFIPLTGEKLAEKFRHLSLHPVKTPAVVLGMTGAVLVAIPATTQIGFLTWLVANALWVWHGVRVCDRYLMMLFGFYFLTAGLGVISHGI